MHRHRTLNKTRRPCIKGRAKLTVKITCEDHGEGYIEYGAVGYVGSAGKRRRIGAIYAYKDSSSSYLTITSAFLNPGYTGKGYGHILYWSLAKKAQRLGFKGIRSSCYGRNAYSESAWMKIRTHSRGKYSYIKFD